MRCGRKSLEAVLSVVHFSGEVSTEPDGTLKAKGDGWGFGGNIGLTWQVAERQRLAVRIVRKMDAFDTRAT
jgi:hypothetical protein